MAARIHAGHERRPGRKRRGRDGRAQRPPRAAAEQRRQMRQRPVRAHGATRSRVAPSRPTTRSGARHRRPACSSVQVSEPAAAPWWRIDVRLLAGARRAPSPRGWPRRGRPASPRAPSDVADATFFVSRGIGGHVVELLRSRGRAGCPGFAVMSFHALRAHRLQHVALEVLLGEDVLARRRRAPPSSGSDVPLHHDRRGEAGAAQDGRRDVEARHQLVDDAARARRAAASRSAARRSARRRASCRATSRRARGTPRRGRR